MTGGKIESVYIVGLGALGSIYASKLADSDPSIVKIIADKKRVAALKSSNVSVNGRSFNFNFISPGDQHPPAGLIIIAVKNNQLEQAIADARSFIGPGTVVISLLNGIVSEDIIGDSIGKEHLLYAYALGMDAVRTGNATTYSVPGKLVFGEKRNTGLSERVKAVKTLFEDAKIHYDIPEDMIRALWFKFMMNTGINQASAVLKAPYGVFQRNENALQLVLNAAKEVMALSVACGINLNEADVNEFTRVMHTLHPSGKTSMLQDIEAGRKTEVDIFAGTVMQLGKKYNVATPVNETLYYIIRCLEDRAAI